MQLTFLAACLVASAADFEAPPAQYQTSPHPAHGQTVSANPPCFVYPATKTFDAYVVEVSHDSTFPPNTTVCLQSPYMLIAPSQAFKPGTYWWRWRPGKPGDGSKNWSSVRSFVVPDGVPVVPFPDMRSLAARIGKSRPRIQVTGTPLNEIKDRARRVFGKRWLDKVRSRAEHARRKKLLAEPNVLPRNNPERHRELYQKTFKTTRPFFREMVSLAQDYLLTGNELSGQEAKRRLLHIISWDPRGSTSLGHNDEPATEVVRYCPTVFDRVYHLLNDDEKQRCLDCLLVRMTEMRDRWRRRPFEKHPYESHNMGYYLPDMLEACLALAGDAPVEEFLHYTMLQLWSPFYPPYGGADGGWSEGPSYWGWLTAVFARMYRLVQDATGVPVHLRSHMRNMAFYKLYGNPPYFRTSPFGDGQASPAGGGATMAMLASMYDNPYAKWYATWKNTQLNGMDALLFDSGHVESRPPYNLPQGHAFFDVGLACMHSVLPNPESNVAILMRSSPFGSISHAYADQNTFMLDAYGEPLIIASGYYQLYGDPHHAQWTRETKASNSVLVNGEGQSKRDWDAKGKLLTFATTAAGDYASGDATQAYKGRLERFRRHIVFLRPIHTGGEPVVIIRDDLVAPGPSTYQFLLHALNRMDVDGDRQMVTVSKGKSRCRVHFLAPNGLAFDQHDQFTKPPTRTAPNQWHLTAGTVKKARTCASLIVLQPYRIGQDDQLPEPRVGQGSGCTAAVLTNENYTLTVVFRNNAAKRVVFGDIVTDAQVAAVCSVDDRIRSAVMFGGTSLSVAGSTLLESTMPGACSVSSYSEEHRIVSSDAPPGTLFTARVGGKEKWEQRGTPFVKGTGLAEKIGPLHVAGQPPSLFDVTRHDWVQHLIAEAPIPSGNGHYEVKITISNTGDGRLPVTIKTGGSVLGQTLAPGQREADLVLPAVSLGGGRSLEVSANCSLGGRLVLHRADVKRAYGVNLLPNGSFEERADGVPVGWRAVTITRDAQAAIASAEGGRQGGRCLKVTCTDATGGDFGGMLDWPRIPPSEIDRTFRMSCWVKTDATSVAGLQVTSSDWQWNKNTKRLGNCEDWRETALEFVLPSGQDLTHVRLQMNAERTGAELFVDDVSLVEMQPE